MSASKRRASVAAPMHGQHAHVPIIDLKSKYVIQQHRDFKFSFNYAVAPNGHVVGLDSHSIEFKELFWTKEQLLIGRVDFFNIILDNTVSTSFKGATAPLIPNEPSGRTWIGRTP